MKGLQKRILAIVMTVTLVSVLSTQALATTSKESLNHALQSSVSYLQSTVKTPKIGSIGGEWVILGLARSGLPVPQAYWEDYYAAVAAEVKASQGSLHEKKYTEYSRIILALTAIGADPRNVAGYNLLTPLGDFEKTIWQGINGPIWALLALDSGNYTMPVNANAGKQATRQMYIEDILARQLADGGWSLNGSGGGSSPSDPDVTGMVLQALSKYQSQERVKAATERALSCLSMRQEADGGYASWGTSNAESVVQVIVALGELGIDPNDSRFVKQGKTLLDNLLSYQQANGSFRHMSAGSGSSQMASEQGCYALVSALRAAEGKPSLYRMTDVTIKVSGADGGATGLSGKHADVKPMPLSHPDKTFSDLAQHKTREAIEALAQRSIINGTPDGLFCPDQSMTRAEFATIVVKALGLEPKADSVFIDVKADQWYAPYVGTAYGYEIVGGVGDQKFNPSGKITRQDAAIMVARAAKLCGMDTTMNSTAIRDALAPFGDYVTVSSWAKEGVAFCYQERILDPDDLKIEPARPILRAEIAQMLYNLLSRANLL